MITKTKNIIYLDFVKYLTGQGKPNQKSRYKVLLRFFIVFEDLLICVSNTLAYPRLKKNRKDGRPVKKSRFYCQLNFLLSYYNFVENQIRYAMKSYNNLFKYSFPVWSWTIDRLDTGN